MKNLKNLGTALNKAEQKEINGGKLPRLILGCIANVSEAQCDFIDNYEWMDERCCTYA